MQKTFRIEIGEGLGHVMDDALVETVGDFPPPVTLRQCHHAEGKREGASQASASLFTATLQPTKFGRAPSDIENQDMRLLWFKKRCATLVGEGCFFRAVDDLEWQAGLASRPVQEELSIRGSATGFRCDGPHAFCPAIRSEEHTSELQSRGHLVCRLLLEK